MNLNIKKHLGVVLIILGVLLTMD
jgi:hypothetical protein